MYVETVGTQGLPWREDSRIARLRAYLQRRFFVVTYQRMDYAPMASEGERSAFFVLPDKPLVAPERSAGVFYAKRPHIPCQAETARKGRLLPIRMERVPALSIPYLFPAGPRRPAAHLYSTRGSAPRRLRENTQGGNRT